MQTVIRGVSQLKVTRALDLALSRDDLAEIDGIMAAAV